MRPTLESPIINIFFFGRSSQITFFLFVVWFMCGFPRVPGLFSRLSVRPRLGVVSSSGLGSGVLWSSSVLGAGFGVAWF